MDSSKPDSNLLKSKKHFELLDGLRGIAAIAVVIFHFMEIVYTDYSKNFIGHGFLAVDFFFCLSGFVIGYAYDDRIGKIGVVAFFKSRLIRLHPLVILGAILGLLGFYFAPFASNAEPYGAGRMILLFLASIFLIPFPVMADRGFNLFGLNAPSWSLFWEYIANILYAFVLCHLKRSYLFLLALISGIGICLICYRSGNLMGGWGGPNFWDGAVRISYSFLAGMFVYRSNWIIRNNLGFIGLALLLTLAFVMPYSKWNWITEPLVVLFYFPLLIALGAGSALNQKAKKVCIFSGKISYPLYMTHYVVMWVFLSYDNAYKPGTAQLAFIIIIGTAVLTGFAYLVMVFYDEPVRKYLNRNR